MEELIKKAKRGNKKAFDSIILIVQKRLYIIAKSKLRYENDVLDIMQSTFLKAYKNLKSLKCEDKFVNWITNILINDCNTFLKQNILHNPISYEENEVENYYYGKDEYLEIDDKIDFFLIIDSLNDEEKTIMSMYYSYEYTTKEISEILGITEGTIRSKISRAKCKIIKKYRNGE